MHFVRLLDGQSFEIISTYPLDTYECGCSILSCSFSDDSNVYYCVGTAYVLPEENEPTKVQIICHGFSFICLQVTYGMSEKYKEISWASCNGRPKSFCALPFLWGLQLLKVAPLVLFLVVQPSMCQYVAWTEWRVLIWQEGSCKIMKLGVPFICAYFSGISLWSLNPLNSY